MSLVQLADKNRIGTLVGVTIMLQLTVIVTGMLLKLSLPGKQIAPPLESSLSNFSSAELSELSDSLDAEPAPVLDPAPLEQQAGPKVLSYRLKAGDTLSRIWEIHRAPASGPALAAQAFKDAKVPLGALRVGEEIELQLSPAGDITALRKRLPDGKELILDGDSSTGYKASIVKPDLVVKEKVVSGTIMRSFSTAANRAEVPPSVVDELVDLFSARVEFSRELQPGDMFALVYDEHRLPSGELVKTGPIKAASLEKAGRRLFAVRHIGQSGKAAYYDQDGKPLGDYFLRYPLQFSRISSAFSYGRFHPILKKTLPHNGIDFAAPLGTPVRTVANGTVTYAGYSLGGGNTVKVRHNDRYTTAYLHLHTFANGIKKGSILERGQVLGTVGSTGLSTGPHLHFSFYDRSTYVNPLKVDLPSNGNADPIPPKVLQAKLEQLIQSQDLIRLAAKEEEGRRS